MARTTPYQPLLLRLLHGLSAALVIGALITGFWVYNTYDGRFVRLPLPNLPDIQGLHGTFGLVFLILLPFFALYSFHIGYRRLIQPDSLKQLSRVGEPIWWVTLQRLTNTGMLLAAVLAVMSGRMMKEEWLPAGQLDHGWYYLHLGGWVVMLLSLLLHLLMSAKVGGMPLLLSMISLQVRADDSPSLWPTHVRNWLSRFRSRS
ncbi:MAG TPA: cytochrome b/b6 domain-containing protein [Synechococcales cyanobacterium M55_K2018_004]|nr:cytochrome b/b6 domain-containing protein [Synechococcales cyanobacterium M55_K2018_004]